MKNIVLLISLLAMVSCQPKPDSESRDRLDHYKNNRVKLVEQTWESDGRPPAMFIIEVDGKEYLAQYKGGICPLVK